VVGGSGFCARDPSARSDTEPNAFFLFVIRPPNNDQDLAVSNGPAPFGILFGQIIALRKLLIYLILVESCYETESFLLAVSQQALLIPLYEFEVPASKGSCQFFSTKERSVPWPTRKSRQKSWARPR